MHEFKKASENIDYEQLKELENELMQYFDQNEGFYKETHHISDVNFVRNNIKRADNADELLVIKN